ncbi:MAG: S46 family peptidase, partial [Gemmatimonadetes bacterium]|nr:S46 family peptidase [Gemmatimonadota bacterium]
LVRGYYAAQYIGAKLGGAPADALDELRDAILGVDQQPPDLQEALIAARLRDIEAAFGRDNPRVTSVLSGRSAEGAAAIVVQQSVLSDSAKTHQALDDGTLGMTDPAVQLARSVLTAFGPYQQAIQPLSQQEEDIAREVGRAHFAIFGTAVPPDATFSLRIADGVVGGYPYNGTVAPPYTTLYGLFDRHFSHGSKDWALPEHWLEAVSTLQLSTPLNFVSTADIIGGNSGSPVLDRELRVVGIVFDGNIEGLPGDYIYLEEPARAVAVDARGMIEALRNVYRADRLVQELVGAATPARR